MDESNPAIELSYQALADHLPHLVWIADAEGAIAYYNR